MGLLVQVSITGRVGKSQGFEGSGEAGQRQKERAGLVRGAWPVRQAGTVTGRVTCGSVGWGWEWGQGGHPVKLGSPEVDTAVISLRLTSLPTH